MKELLTRIEELAVANHRWQDRFLTMQQAALEANRQRDQLSRTVASMSRNYDIVLARCLRTEKQLLEAVRGQTPTVWPEGQKRDAGATAGTLNGMWQHGHTDAASAPYGANALDGNPYKHMAEDAKVRGVSVEPCNWGDHSNPCPVGVNTVPPGDGHRRPPAGYKVADAYQAGHAAIDRE